MTGNCQTFESALRGKVQRTKFDNSKKYNLVSFPRSFFRFPKSPDHVLNLHIDEIQGLTDFRIFTLMV